MLCQGCLNKAIQKLHTEDLILLEYLGEKEANSPQFSLKNDFIRAETQLTAHQAYTAILRLETLEMIGVQKWSRSNKYYITPVGYEALKLLQEQAQSKGV